MNYQGEFPQVGVFSVIWSIELVMGKDFKVPDFGIIKINSDLSDNSNRSQG